MKPKPTTPAPPVGAPTDNTDEIRQQLSRALGCNSSPWAERWAEYRHTGLGNDDLRQAISRVFGSEGGVSGPSDPGYYYKGGQDPKFWLGHLNHHLRPPTLRGAKLLSTVRAVLNLPLPGISAPQRLQSACCPKCDAAIYIEQDTKPDGRIVCPYCKARFAGYETLLAAIAAKYPTPPPPLLAQRIPVDLVDPNPHQPRQHFDENELKALADNIQRRGLIQPIVVHANHANPPLSSEERGPGGEVRYTLHDGERRWRAHKLAGLTDIAAYIVPPPLALRPSGPGVLGTGADAQEMLLRAIAANDQRTDLSPIERARSYQKLHDDYGLSDAQIAQEVGKSRSVVANLRRLLQLPEERQAQIASGELNERQALALLPLYQLPPQVQQNVLNYYPSSSLNSPEKLTSDAIRDVFNRSLNGVSQEITLIDPDAVFEGAGIYRATCTGCDCFHKKTDAGQDKLRCLNCSCLGAKQIVLQRGYLEQASLATGLPYADPGIEFKWHELDGFYGTFGHQIAEHALQNHCLRLHLRYTNSQNGSGPERFKNAAYYCIHPGQKHCACAKVIEAQQEQAKKIRTAEIDQLRDQVKTHLVALIQSTPAAVLRVTLYTEMRYESKKQKYLTLSPGKLAGELADFWIGPTTSPSTRPKPSRTPAPLLMPGSPR